MNTIKNFIEHKAYCMRISSLLMTTQAGSGHPTSALSAADIVATLFFYAMQFDPQDPHNANNDHFILSKGHASPILYAVWKELGVLSDEQVLTYRQIHSELEGHPTPRFSRSEAATGSLGQGLSIGLGMALADRLSSIKNYTYVLMGDSESAEGSVWEATELAAYYKTDNLIAIIDDNRLGQTTETIDGWDLDTYYAKYQAFGWHCLMVDGHNVQDLMNVFDQAKELKGKPVMIIAKTIKGYGVAQAENKNGFHGKAFSKKELPEILDELKTKFAASVLVPDYKWSPRVPDYVWSARVPEVSSLDTLPFGQHSRWTEKQSAHPECLRSKRIEGPTYKLGEQLPTRASYGQALATLGTVCPALVSLDAEVKNSTFAELFEQKHPNRFFQCFVAEQNMVGMAVGFAHCGYIPFVSTFACFFSRAYDQIRMAAIGHAPLRLCGSHAGVSIGEDGPSQMGLEDIAIMRAIPNSIILYPCDAVSAYHCVQLMATIFDGISYLRTTRGATPVIYPNDEKFCIGGCKVLKQSDNDSACIVAAGITVHEALKAYELLQKKNISIAVIDLYCIKPIDRATVIAVAKKSNNHIITVEDHYLEGGLGQAVAYEIRNTTISLDCLAVTTLPRSGKPDELMAMEGINAQAIIQLVESF